MVKVYFESDTASELVATFEYEEDYNSCAPVLHMIALDRGYLRVTESVEGESK